MGEYSVLSGISARFGPKLVGHPEFSHLGLKRVETLPISYGFPLSTFIPLSDLSIGHVEKEFQ